jgi:hypothetical protein
MIIEINYREMAYLRSLLQKDTPYPDSIDEESNKLLLQRIQNLDDEIKAELEGE